MMERQTDPQAGQTPGGRAGGSVAQASSRGKLRSSSGRFPTLRLDSTECAAPSPPAPAPSYDREEVILGVAHDLRSPLSSIILAAQVLHGRDSDPERRRRIEAIVRAAKRAIHLVDNLSHLEEDGLPLLLEDHSIIDVVREALDLHGPQAEASGLTLRLEENAPGLEARCDRAQLCRAVSNFLGNAVKFSPHGELVTVRLDRRDGWVRVSVNDHGPGIRGVDLERVFERVCGRGYGGPGRARRGLGLGLTITRAIAEAHGGRVGVHSRPGIGSTFWIEVPSS
jgi:signal transduction histidine kinase